MVGGQAPKAIRSVECYDFEEERWDQVAELPSRRCRAGNGNFSCNLLCFLSAALQRWMDVLSHPFSLPPGLKQLFLFAIPSSSFPTATYPSRSGGCPALQRGCSCLSAFHSRCLPFLISLSQLLRHQYFPSSSHPAGLAAHRHPVFLAGFLVKIKGAESVPLSAEEWVMESRSVSWECSSEDI